MTEEATGRFPCLTRALPAAQSTVASVLHSSKANLWALPSPVVTPAGKFLTARTWRPIDLILNQLVFANTLALLSKGVPHTMAAFGMKSFLDEPGCKVVICVYRVSRGVTLSTTCLLSSFQALKLQPGVSGCVQPRLRSAKGVALCCALCWLLHLLFNLAFGKWITVPKASKNLTVETMYRFCSIPAAGAETVLTLAMIFFITDAMFLSLMAWASGSMLLVLHRHRQRVQYIHSHTLGPRASCEMRATGSILVLVSLFLSFYSLSSLLSLYAYLQVGTPSPWLVSMSYLVSSGFSTLSPLVFIFNDAHFSWLCSPRYTGR
ncbi:vomeronasal type-1 receptor 1-like [Perognathus longimembris pacificus]|uniref:vomeronasal type-1 receptor 1-like n=1 Tax=Perognathus longimembris pacificus TaxID=214514 RepID=UPI002018467D|nr:vomeronasal type-1 receptor 1-like [Perognathus longimembris pacificus]